MTRIKHLVLIGMAIVIVSICYPISGMAYNFRPEPQGAIAPKSGGAWYQWDIKMKEDREKVMVPVDMFVVSIDENGNLRRESIEQALESDRCAVIQNLDGLSGPITCCPNRKMAELRKKQALECDPPEVEPRKLGIEEIALLGIEELNCEPYICDGGCEEESDKQPNSKEVAGSRWRGDPRLMEGDGDDIGVDPDEGKTDSNTDDADKAAKDLIDLYRDRDKAKKDLEDAEKAAKDAADKARDAEKAAKDAENAKKNFATGNVTAEDKKHLKDIPKVAELRKDANTAKADRIRANGAVFDAKKALDDINGRIEKAENSMPNPNGDNDPYAREKYCKLFPNNCPEKNRYQGYQGLVDTWASTPKPDGSDFPEEDDKDHTVFEFLCIEEVGISMDSSGNPPINPDAVDPLNPLFTNDCDMMRCPMQSVLSQKTCMQNTEKKLSFGGGIACENRNALVTDPPRN